MARFLEWLHRAAEQLSPLSTRTPLRFDVPTDVARIRVAMGLARLHYSLEPHGHRGPRLRPSFGLDRSGR